MDEQKCTSDESEFYKLLYMSALLWDIPSTPRLCTPPTSPSHFVQYLPHPMNPVPPSNSIAPPFDPCLPLAGPRVVPRLLSWCIRLRTRILNRHSIRAKDTLLLQGDSVQASGILVARPLQRPQLLAGIVHALVHPSRALATFLSLSIQRGQESIVPLQLQLLLRHLLPPKQHPRAMDRPVSQTPHATQAQGARRLRVLEMVADQLHSGIWLEAALAAVLGIHCATRGEVCGRGREGAEREGGGG